MFILEVPVDGFFQSFSKLESLSKLEALSYFNLPGVLKQTLLEKSVHAFKAILR